MESKISTLAGYALLLALVVFSPVILGQPLRAVLRRHSRWVVLVAAVASLPLVVMPFLQSAAGILVLNGIVAGAAWLLLGQQDRKVAGYLLLLLAANTFSLLLWWRKGGDFSAAELALVGAIAIGCMGLRRVPREAIKEKSLKLWPAFCTGLALIYIHWRAVEVRSHLSMAWHHWGAYLGSAEAVKSGLVPFVDIPLQYGLGPTLTLLVAAVPGGFDRMYWLALFFTLVAIYIVVDLCLFLVKKNPSTIERAAVGLCALAACLLWVSLPSQVGSPLIAPSTFGFRFAPAIVLMWLMIKHPDAWRGAFLLWAACSLWSIEGIYYGALIYWSNQLWRRWETPQPKLLVLATVAVQALLALLCVGLVFCVVFYGVFGTTPNPRLFGLYLLNPPGLLPIDWGGAIWWIVFLTVLALAALGIDASQDDDARHIRLCSMALLAFFSYFLGRSHENNIVNLMPAAAILLAAIAGSRQGSIASASLLGLFLLVAYLPFFGANFHQPFAPPKLNAWSTSMSFRAAPNTALGQIADHIRNVRHEPFSVIDAEGAVNIESLGSEGVWHGLHPLSNYGYVPSAVRRDILRCTSARFKDGGWLVFGARGNKELADDFLAVYSVSEHFEHGGWLALRLQPHQEAGTGGDDRKCNPPRLDSR